ncbi:hypothetical protein Tco_1011710 [Tanacetum coccineum]
MVKVPYTAEYNVFAVETQHTDQPKNMNGTSLMEKVDSNTTHGSPDMCNNEFKDDQNADDHEDERVVLANLISNLKLNTDENKKIQKQLRKANATLTHELNEYKSALEDSNDIRDRCRSALHDQDIELEKYKKYKNCQLEKEEMPYDKDDLANIFAPNCDETLILEEESRSKLDKELTKKHDYTYQNNLKLALQHEKENNVGKNSWVKQSLTSGNTKKALKDKIDSLIAELNRKTLEMSEVKA